MEKLKMRRIRVAAALLAALLAADTIAAQPASQVTLLTYNVKGLPWPVAKDRQAALAAIANRLRTLRDQGRQPGLVALQEAFIPEAKAIGRAAGYRYMALGPGRDDPASQAMTSDDRTFMADSSFMIGERGAKRVDSGLAIFSDYPIVAVHRTAYAICAGYDCLANKGALAVEVAVPGYPVPLVVVDTHLNSGMASGAPRDRSTYAYRRQLEALKSFIAGVAPNGAPMLVAGDFNVGTRPVRRDYFDGQFLRAGSSLFAAGTACSRALACAGGSPGGVAESMRRGKDWLLYRPSRSLPLRPTDLTASFGRAPDGSMLSDHIGVTVTYALDAPPRFGSGRLELASR